MNFVREILTPPSAETLQQPGRSCKPNTYTKTRRARSISTLFRFDHRDTLSPHATATCRVATFTSTLRSAGYANVTTHESANSPSLDGAMPSHPDSHFTFMHSLTTRTRPSGHRAALTPPRRCGTCRGSGPSPPGARCLRPCQAPPRMPRDFPLDQIIIGRQHISSAVVQSSRKRNTTDVK